MTAVSDEIDSFAARLVPRAVRKGWTSLRGGLVVLVIWQLAITAFDPPRYLLPAPLAVADTLVTRLSFLAENAATTLAEAILGLVLGTLAGVLSGAAVVGFPRFGALAWPVLLVLQAIPVFALAPLLVIWFGFGMASKIVMAALILFFPVASAFADGLRRTDAALIEVAELAGASRFQTFRWVRIPLAVPAFVTGLRVAAPLAPLGAVIGEWVGASGGLGFVMIQANARMQTEIMFAAIVLLAAMTLVLRFLVDAIAARLTPWAVER